MADRAELIKKIDQLPPKYIGKIFDFISYLQQEAKSGNNNEIAAYQAMAADIEREQEASEWCNSYFGPACNK